MVDPKIVPKDRGVVLGWRTGVERVRTRPDSFQQVVIGPNAKTEARHQWVSAATYRASGPKVMVRPERPNSIPKGPCTVGCGMAH